MKTRKNFWASLIIALGWSMLIVMLELLHASNIYGWALMLGPMVAFFATYQILRVLQYVPDVLEKQETPRRSQRRVDDLLSKLDEAELELVRERLADLEAGEFEPLGDLLDSSRDKRKNR
jgi:hypothetical protein